MRKEVILLALEKIAESKTIYPILSKLAAGLIKKLPLIDPKSEFVGWRKAVNYMPKTNWQTKVPGPIKSLAYLSTEELEKSLAFADPSFSKAIKLELSKRAK